MANEKIVKTLKFPGSTDDYQINAVALGGKLASDYATKDDIANAGNGDMLKSVYDKDNDGVVDNAEKLGGVAAADYATKTDLSSKAAISHTHSANDIAKAGYLITHPEQSNNTIIPFINNDLAFLTLKGGSIRAYTTTSTDLTAATLQEGELNLSGSDKLFNGVPSCAYLMTDGNYVAVIDLTLHKTFNYNNNFYIDFGLVNYRAKNVSVYVMNKDTETAYTLKGSVVNSDSSYHYYVIKHTSTNSSGATVQGFNKMRVVLSNFNASGSSYGRRIAEIGLINYSSGGLSETYISRGGCDGIYGNLVPQTSYLNSLGNASKKWAHVFASEFNGNLKGNVTGNVTGNADTATALSATCAIEKGGTGATTAAGARANLGVPTKVSELTNDLGFKTTDNNTTYTFATGDNNGQFKVTPSGGSAQNVSIKGLASAAYASKGVANGVAELDATGKVPSSQLPSYVDDVVEGTLSAFPATGETGKIYVDTTTNKTYRWSGSTYTEISASLALGETSSTAYRGDRGKTAYDHSQSTHARTDATNVSSSSTNGKIKINGTETTVYTHPTTHAASMITGLSTVATSGKYSDLSGTPTIPTVNNGTLTIQKNGTNVQTFTANQSSSVTANITVPTKVSELTNDSGFKTTDTNTTYDLAASTSSTNGNVKLNLTAGGSGSGTDSVTIKGSGATTVTTDANGVVTISSTDNDTKYTHPTSSGNKHIPSGGSSGQILRWYADGTATWGADSNTTYSAATQSAQGLMSAADKKKLDGIASGATANTGTITGVTAGNGLTGGGTSGGVTLSVGAGTGITVNADTIEVKYGTSSGTACAGNDSRLSNARTPTSHTHGNIANDGTIASTAVTSATGVLVYDSNNKIQRATAANLRTIIGAGTSNLTIGTTSTTAAAGNHTHNSYVPTSRTVNGKALSSNITLSTDDITAGTETWYFYCGTSSDVLD